MNREIIDHFCKCMEGGAEFYTQELNSKAQAKHKKKENNFEHKTKIIFQLT